MDPWLADGVVHPMTVRVIGKRRQRLKQNALETLASGLEIVKLTSHRWSPDHRHIAHKSHLLKGTSKGRSFRVHQQRTSTLIPPSYRGKPPLQGFISNSPFISMATNILHHRHETHIGETTFQHTFVLAERTSGRNETFFRGGALMRRSRSSTEILRAIHEKQEQMREVVLRPAPSKNPDQNAHENRNDQILPAKTSARSKRIAHEHDIEEQRNPRANSVKDHRMPLLRGNRNT